MNQKNISQEKLSKTIALSISIITIIFLGTIVVQAWTEPSVSPPGNNVPAPLNVGGAAQMKAGQLNISRDGLGECCSSGDYTFSVAENTASTGRWASIQFHNGGEAEGYLRLYPGPHGRELLAGSYQTDMDLHATGIIRGDQGLCIGGDCRSAWPSEGIWQESGSDIYYNSGNVGIGTASPNTKLEIKGGHGDTKLRLYSIGNGGTSDAYLSLWASEPGWTYTGVGIGNNINGSAYYGRINTNRGASYIRLLDNSIVFNTIDSSGTDTRNMTMSDGNITVPGLIRADGGLYVSDDERIYRCAEDYVCTDDSFMVTGGGWLRVDGGEGLYFQSYGGGWHMTDSTWIRAYNNKNVYTPGEIRAGTIRGNSNVCIGSDCRTSWPVDTNTDTQNLSISGHTISLTSGGSVTVPDNVGITSESDTLDSVADRGASTDQNLTLNNSSPTVYLKDTNNRSAMIHANSNIFYVLRGCDINSGSWCTTGGYWPLTINLENNDATFGRNVYANAYYCRSDIRLKQDLQELNGVLDKIKNINAYSFRWIQKDLSETEQIGLIAQEVEKEFPQLVNTDVNGYKNIDYQKVAPVLLSAIKEQQTEIEELNVRIEALELIIIGK